MKQVIAAAALLWMANTGTEAASLCNCCDGEAGSACSAVCASAAVADGQCGAVVDYDGRAAIAPDKNPLYGVSLKDVGLGNPTGMQLEAFRRLLERARRGAEDDRRRALRSRAKGKLDAAAAAALTKRYDDALVNYYLGLQAYRIAARRRNQQ